MEFLKCRIRVFLRCLAALANVGSKAFELEIGGSIALEADFGLQVFNVVQECGFGEDVPNCFFHWEQTFRVDPKERLSETTVGGPCSSSRAPKYLSWDPYEGLCGLHLYIALRIAFIQVSNSTLCSIEGK